MLGDQVVPTAYDLELVIDPDRPSYTGKVDIEVRVAHPVSTLWLHGEGLGIDGVVVRSRTGPRAIELAAPPRLEPGGRLGLDLATPLPVGGAVVSIEFSGVYRKRDGLFRQPSSNHSYVFTDFEPIDARRAFPCFDEPRFKAPWRISLVIPKGAVGLSNMPATSTRPVGDGNERVAFARTRPLPSYLIAVAVGPFEVVVANAVPGSGRDRNRGAGERQGWPPSAVPIRIVVPRGKRAWAREASRMAPDLLELVAGYMGSPVPFPKLDLVAVPTFDGAMENPGLITVAAHILLSDPGNPSLPQLRLLAKVCAHEFAHLWFGDLLTPRDWNDLWLNEGFATWLADKVLDRWSRSRGQPVEAVVERNRAMMVDGYLAARAVRQVGRTRDALRLAFDPLSYQKGAAILAMFEAWLSESVFRDAVRAYVATHADGSVTAESFFAAISAAAGRDVGPALGGFLDNPGIPEVVVELSCEGGRAAVTLERRRHLVLAARQRARPSMLAARWQVPLCLRFATGAGTSARQCTLLDRDRARVELAGGGCPAWVMPNADAHGYFRYRLPAAQLAALGRAPLSAREATDLAFNLRALLYSGDLPVGDALAVLEDLAARPGRHAAEAVIALLGEVADHLLEPDDEARFQPWILALYGARAHGLGFRQKPGESEDDTLLRPVLVEFIGRRGGDPRLVARANRLAATWLRTGRGIERGMIEPTLRIAAHHGDAALYDRVAAALSTTGEPSRRRLLLAGLAAFRSPALIERSLALVGDAAFEDRLQLLQELLERPASRARAMAFVADHGAALRRSEPLALLAPLYTGAPCSERDLATAEELAEFVPTARTLWAPRLVRVSREVRACTAFRAAHAAGLRAFLRR